MMRKVTRVEDFLDFCTPFFLMFHDDTLVDISRALFVYRRVDFEQCSVMILLRTLPGAIPTHLIYIP